MKIKKYNNKNKDTLLQDLYNFITKDTDTHFLATKSHEWMLFRREILGEVQNIYYKHAYVKNTKADINEILMNEFANYSELQEENLVCHYFPSINIICKIYTKLITLIKTTFEIKNPAFEIPSINYADVKDEISEKLKKTFFKKAREIYPPESSRHHCGLITHHKAINSYIQGNITSYEDMDKCISLSLPYSMYDVYKYLSNKNDAKYFKQKYITEKWIKAYESEILTFYHLLALIKEWKENPIVAKRKIMHDISQKYRGKRMNVVVKATRLNLVERIFCEHRDWEGKLITIENVLPIIFSNTDNKDWSVVNFDNYTAKAPYDIWGGVFKAVDVKDIMMIKHKDEILYTNIWFDGC